MIKLENVSFQYGENEKNSLKNINLTIGSGEVVVLCGESGCGKTSIIRLINGLIPFYYPGKLEGNIFIDDLDCRHADIYKISEKVSSVFQNPRSQFFCVDVVSELAFGAENRKIDPQIIKNRIEEVGTKLDIKKLYGRTMFALSGGEKQKIACGSVNITDNNIVVLDEPSSNLDLLAIEDLKKMIALWKTEGKTVVIAEHRLWYLKDLMDRILFVKDGEIKKEYKKHDFLSLPAVAVSELGLRAINFDYETFGVKQWGDDVISIRDFKYHYPNTKKVAVDVPDFNIPKGAVVAIVGKNGAGKSTFVRCLCGLERKVRGTVWNCGEKESRNKRLKKSYIIMQDVNRQLFTESVRDEIILSMKEEDEAQVDKLLVDFDLQDLGERHPVSLSGGQKQRVAVASAIASQREYIFFDEPTSGLDLKHMKQVADCILGLQKLGKTVFLITHDLELICQCCNFVIHIEDGKIKDNYRLDDSGGEKLSKIFK